MEQTTKASTSNVVGKRPWRKNEQSPWCRRHYFFVFFVFGQADHINLETRSKRQRAKSAHFSLAFGFWPRPPSQGGALCRRHRAGVSLGHSHHSNWCIAATTITASSEGLTEHSGESEYYNSNRSCKALLGAQDTVKADSDPAAKSHSEIAYCCETYKRLAVDLKSATCVIMLGIKSLAERLVPRTMLDPRPIHWARQRKTTYCCEAYRRKGCRPASPTNAQWVTDS